MESGYRDLNKIPGKQSQGLNGAQGMSGYQGFDGVPGRGRGLQAERGSGWQNEGEWGVQGSGHTGLGLGGRDNTGGMGSGHNSTRSGTPTQTHAEKGRAGWVHSEGGRWQGTMPSTWSSVGGWQGEGRSQAGEGQKEGQGRGALGEGRGWPGEKRGLQGDLLLGSYERLLGSCAALEEAVAGKAQVLFFGLSLFWNEATLGVQGYKIIPGK